MSAQRSDEEPIMDVVRAFLDEFDRVRSIKGTGAIMVRLDVCQGGVSYWKVTVERVSQSSKTGGKTSSEIR